MNKEISIDKIQSLFSSVGWGKKGNWRGILKSIQNSETVITAWEEDNLIGLVNAISDRTNTVYIHYVLVHENFQNQGIGEIIVRKILDCYHDYHHIILVSSKESIGFFESCGFYISEASAMEIRR